MDTKDMEITIDLREFAKALYKARIFLLLSALLGFLAVYLYTGLFVEKQYSASLRLYVSNGADGDVIDSGSLSASERLGSTYIAILQDDYVLQKVADELNVGYTGEEIHNMVTISSVNSTEVLEITAVTTNPHLSARICNTLGDKVAREVIEDIFDVAAIKVISPATVPSRPSGPRVIRNSFLGFIVGLMLSGGLICLLEILDNTLKSPDDIKSRFDLPVLGEIPDFALQYNKKSLFKRKNKNRVKPATTKLN